MTEQMIDMAGLSAKHASVEAAHRVKRRHWAEFRLRAYGILAIAVAVIALLILIYTIFAKALSVTHEHYISLTVDVEVTDRQMKRVEDPNPRLLPNLNKLVRGSLKETAGADLDRKGRKQLNALLSTDAGLELGKAVKADPALIGGPLRFDALLDDQLQLYLGGAFGTLEDAGTEGEITITSGDDDSVTIDFAPAAMTEARAAVQQDRALEARNARRSARDQARAFDETEAALANAADEADRQTLQTSLDSYRAARDQANQRAEQIEAQANNVAAIFTLREDDPSIFIQINRGWIKLTQLGPDRATGVIMDPLTEMGTLASGDWTALMFERPEAERKINDRQMLWLENFKRAGKIESMFNWRLLQSSDSSNAELAGIWGALVGSFWTMIVTFLLAFPIGVMASIYLEEFAPKNKVTELIEVNINNLAAVPSIVFGLLGITVLITGVKLFGTDLFDGILKSITEDPRSTPLAGGVVLALMSLPTIIIASRASIKAVPPSIRDAALGLGASRLQTASHHVLPLAMPGILTGSIIAMAQALGETAPLIIVGMNAFIQDPPGDPLDKANVLPSLIYLWNNQSERLFDGKTAMAIAVLLIFLVLMNTLAVLLRKRFERRW
ncbi:MAG: phosphate ABC transporter permease PstA [Pseudomonadota bacterium]